MASDLESAEVRTIEKILLRLGNDDSLSTQIECDIILEIVSVGTWILKFRKNGMIANNCDNIYKRYESDAVISFSNFIHFMKVLREEVNYSDLIKTLHIREKGSSKALELFSTRLKLLISNLKTKGNTTLSNTITTISPTQILKSGYLLKKRDVFGGWRGRYFEVYYGRLDYYVEEHDINPRGSIDLYDAKISDNGLMNINGSDHWSILIEPVKDRTLKLATELLGENGRIDMKQWVQIFIQATQRPLIKMTNKGGKDGGDQNSSYINKDGHNNREGEEGGSSSDGGIISMKYNQNNRSIQHVTDQNNSKTDYDKILPIYTLLLIDLLGVLKRLVRTPLTLIVMSLVFVLTSGGTYIILGGHDLYYNSHYWYIYPILVLCSLLLAFHTGYIIDTLNTSKLQSKPSNAIKVSADSYIQDQSYDTAKSTSQQQQKVSIKKVDSDILSSQVDNSNEYSQVTSSSSSVPVSAATVSGGSGGGKRNVEFQLDPSPPTTSRSVSDSDKLEDTNATWKVKTSYSTDQQQQQQHMFHSTGHTIRNRALSSSDPNNSKPGNNKIANAFQGLFKFKQNTNTATNASKVSNTVAVSSSTEESSSSATPTTSKNKSKSKVPFRRRSLSQLYSNPHSLVESPDVDKQSQSTRPALVSVVEEVMDSKRSRTPLKSFFSHRDTNDEKEIKIYDVDERVVNGKSATTNTVSSPLHKLGIIRRSTITSVNLTGSQFEQFRTNDEVFTSSSPSSPQQDMKPNRLHSQSISTTDEFSTGRPMMKRNYSDQL